MMPSSARSYPLPTSHHQGWRPGQVATDRGKVKGGDGGHEALEAEEAEAAMRPSPRLPAAPPPPRTCGYLQPPVHHAVGAGWHADGLLPLQLHGELGIEAEEVDELGRRIDLRLDHSLALRGGRAGGSAAADIPPVGPHAGPCAHGDITRRLWRLPPRDEYVPSLGSSGQEPGGLVTKRPLGLSVPPESDREPRGKDSRQERAFPESGGRSLARRVPGSCSEHRAKEAELRCAAPCSTQLPCFLQAPESSVK